MKAKHTPNSSPHILSDGAMAKSQGASAHPIRQLIKLAEQSRPGLYPTSLINHEVYWSLIESPNGSGQILLDENGNVEPRAGGPSVVPYLLMGPKLTSAVDCRRVIQIVSEDHSSVRWRGKGYQLMIEVSADEEISVKYTVTNRGKKFRTGSLWLSIWPVSVRPVNGETPEQEFTPIRQIQILENDVMINSERFFSVSKPPYQTLIADLANINIGEYIEDSRQSPAATWSEQGLLGGALEFPFQLNHGESLSICMTA